MRNNIRSENFNVYDTYLYVVLRPMLNTNYASVPAPGPQAILLSWMYAKVDRYSPSEGSVKRAILRCWQKRQKERLY